MTYRVSYFVKSTPHWCVAGTSLTKKEADVQADNLRVAGYEARVEKEGKT